MIKKYKYDIQKTGENLNKESIYSIIDLERNVVIKSDLLAKEASLFIENIYLLEEAHDYLSKKYLDILRIKDSLDSTHREVLINSYNHDIESLLLRLERQINNCRKIEEPEKVQSLVKRLEKFRTNENSLPVFQRLKRAYHLLKTL